MIVSIGMTRKNYHFGNHVRRELTSIGQVKRQNGGGLLAFVLLKHEVDE